MCPYCGADQGAGSQRSISQFERAVTRVGELHDADEALGLPVKLECQEALNQVAAHLTREGASITSRSENSVSFSYRKQGNPIVFMLLLLLFVIPAIIYALTENREVRFTIMAMPAEDGCRLLFGGEYGAGYRAFWRWMRSQT